MDEVIRPRSNVASEVDVREYEISEEDVSLTLSGRIVNKGREYASCTSLNSSTNIRPEKRTREEYDVDEQDKNDNFTLVQGRKYAKRVKNSVTKIEVPSSFEVCVSSNEILPKQIGLAKLLKAEHISNISYIRYKTPYKVIMRFGNQDDCEKLINSSVFKELGYRCHFNNEVYFTYGVVKYIELDLNEKELLEFFKCDTDIISVKRLKRLDEKKEWRESETVRFCFKGATLPQYVHGSGCRFKVEPYTFPVSQCSTCWHYGHLARFCPSRKKICPKCGGEHENCDTLIFTCTNCKGRHVAFNRSCPTFLKEKSIRHIMCKQNCTYKTALSEYLSSQKEVRTNFFEGSDRAGSSAAGLLVLSKHNDDSYDKASKINDSSESGDDADISFSKMNKRRGKKQKKESVIESTGGRKMLFSEVVKTNHNRVEPITLTTRQEEGREEERNTRSKGKEKTFNFQNVLEKLKNIFFADSTLAEKLTLIFKYLLEELKNFFSTAVNSGDLIRKFINIFHNA